MTKYKNQIRISKLENRIFKSVYELKREIKSLFDVDGGVIELIKNKGIDDEYCFFANGFCFSVYIMRGSSGRVFVVETGVDYE